MADASKKLEELLQELGSSITSKHDSAEELFSLLDTTDGLLSRVEQSPSKSTLTALKPLMSVLVAEELLRHSDTDVKVAVASCISEITRITAPEAPYEDDIMKEIFQMIVGAFEGLDDTSNRCYTKRVSILETVAKVRSCVVMLDLECDALILEMFHHFLKSIRLNHSENVFSSMVTIMALVIEESEEISPGLLSCLLDVVKMHKNVLPIARKLVELVMGDCAKKLKPCLVEFVQSTGASLNDYSKVVSSIYHLNSDALDNTDTNTSGETLAEDSKLSERTVSDEMPQVSARLEQEVGSPEKDGIVSDNSQKLGNGTVPRGNFDSIAQPASPKQMPERSRRGGQLKDAIASSLADDGNMESVSKKHDGMSDLNTKKGKGRKTSSSAQLINTTDHSRAENDKDVPAVSSRRKGQNKGTNNLQRNDHSVKEEVSAVPLDSDMNNEQENNLVLENSTPQGISQAPSKVLPESARSKRGRPPGRKSNAKQNDGDAADHQSPASGRKDPLANIQSQDEEIPSKEYKSKKESAGIHDSEVKSRRHLGKKSQLKVAVAGEAPVTVTSDTEIKPQRHADKKGVKRKVTKQESSGKKQKSNIKQQKREVSLEEDVAGEPSSKEVVSSPRTVTMVTSVDQSQLEDSKKPVSRRKCPQGTEEVPKTSDHKNMGDDIVGWRINVWWPDDKKFYDGVIDSFDHVTKKHKVVYTDGDIEVLLLSNELWKFTEGDTEVKEKNPEGTDAPQMTRTKTGRGTLNSVSKQAKTPLQSTSDTEPSDKSGRRPRGRPRGGASKVETVDGNSLRSRKRKGRAVVYDKAKTPTSSGKLKDEPEKSEPVDATPQTSKPGKTGDESKDDTHNLAGETKGDTSTITGSSKNVLARSGLKSKKPEFCNKLKEETCKSGSKSGYDYNKCSEVSPKTASQSEVVAGAGTQLTKQTSRTQKANKSISLTPNGSASIEKMTQEKENVAKAKVGASSGTKRGRKPRTSKVSPKTAYQSEVDVVGAGTQLTKQTSRTKKANKSISLTPNGAASIEKMTQEKKNVAKAKVGASSGTKRGRKRRTSSHN